MYEAIIGALVGLGLAAACGFRVFVPLLVLSIAARAGQVNLSGGMSWLTSDGAIIAFATASVLEVIGYWVPWIDHGLDVVASPAAIIAGTIAAASQFADLGPMLRWTAAIIAGGGLAGVVQATSVGTRAVSTVTTAGVGNPIVSAVHSIWSLVLSVLAVVAPIVAGFVLLIVIPLIGWRLWRWFARRRAARGGPAFD
ncbi:MAG: DUF4126 domain-containing protein [Phycisphaerales bacterium]|nr:DUF4126 domain-containing protein [Phycisphaerales bacterium]